MKSYCLLSWTNVFSVIAIVTCVYLKLFFSFICIPLTILYFFQGYNNFFVCVFFLKLISTKLKQLSTMFDYCPLFSSYKHFHQARDSCLRQVYRSFNKVDSSEGRGGIFTSSLKKMQKRFLGSRFAFFLGVKR